MNVVLISTYELGRQPFGLASPAAWLRARGHSVVCLDLSREPLFEPAIREAGLIAFYVPMHTATRLAVGLIDPVRRLAPQAKLCFYGLYAPVNEPWLRRLGVEVVLGGEFEAGIASLADRLAAREVSPSQRAAPAPQPEPVVSLARQKFLVPDRSGLVPLDRYAALVLPDGARRVVGYTEASRGCKHRCRHCPVVPVYDGVFRVVPLEVVLEDVRRQVRAGARHITFGDPDFLNGPRHALAVVRTLHAEFPALTYDATAKVEHLLARRADLPALRETGCLFLTTAAESFDDAVLARLDKGHSRADFFELVPLIRRAGIALHPTFVPFTPWTTLEGYRDFLALLDSLGLAESVAPVQLSIRLLIPSGSRLLQLDEVRSLVASFDPAALVYPWRHPDERVDCLQREVESAANAAAGRGASRSEAFRLVRRAALAGLGDGREAERPVERPAVSRAAIPYLTEPWYC